MVSPPSQSYLPHVSHHYLFGHVRGTVQHHVFILEPRLFFQSPEKAQRFACVADSPDRRHLKTLTCGTERLVDLLQSK